MIKLGVVMDPIQSIHYEKDSTLAMLWEAQNRGWALHYFELNDLYCRDGQGHGLGRSLHLTEGQGPWFTLSERKPMALSALDLILMRKDPPFDLEYIYATYILEYAEQAGVLVLNKPQSLRDLNEKVAIMQFPECCPPTLVTRDPTLMRAFLSEHHTIICKPLHAMGGHAVFRIEEKDLNANSIFEVLTQRGTSYAMAQRYVPDIREGDKRILLVQGEPMPLALARVPSSEDFRGNLVAGAKGTAQPLTERDRWICQKIGPFLKEKGLFFVGIDVIGDYLTEINVTSPTGIRELDHAGHFNISAILWDAITPLLRKS